MITRIAVGRRELFAGGHEFPITGPYEKLVGKVYGEVDPRHRPNKIIVNLDKAPRNRGGRVEYWSDFCILKPLDMARGNGKMFFDAPNRGSKRIAAFLNDAPQNNDPTAIGDAGNGFLMRQGYTIVWCGWQGDLMPEKNWLVAGVPIATNNGREIVRKVRTEIVGEENHRHPLCLRLGPLAKRKIPPRLCLPRIQRRRGAQKSLRCDCPSRGGRRKIVFELRICPARHFVAATHEPTRSRAFPFRLQCIERSADGKERRNSQTPQDRSVCIPHSNFHGILAKARLSRPHRRERQGRVHPGKSTNLRNSQRAAQQPLQLRTGERRHSTTRPPFVRGGGSPGADRRHGSMGNTGDFSAAESISKSE